MAWGLVAIAFYAPLLILQVVFPDDLLDSEYVYNAAIGALWRGDSSIAHSFLNGNVPILSLNRLTQPLMILFALLPPFPAYVLNDFLVRGIAAAGAFLMLVRLEVPRVPQHLLSVLFAISLANTTYGLSIAGLPLAIWLLDRSERWRLAGLLLIGWNSSLYLSGLFFLPASGFFHALVLREPLDRNFWRGLAAYLADSCWVTSG